MRIIGCDLHARQQTLAMLDTATGEVVNETLPHEGETVREFYARLPGPVRVGIEATGSMKWFLQLMEELGIDCQVGHPATIRAAEPRRQKHDRRDAELILKLLTEDRFRRSGSLRRNCWISEHCSYTVISGYACAPGYRTRCRRLHWPMVYGEGVRCGAKAGKKRLPRYLWERTPLSGAVSCKRCTPGSKRRSNN